MTNIMTRFQTLPFSLFCNVATSVTPPPLGPASQTKNILLPASSEENIHTSIILLFYVPAS
jgi:hypothetical protein